MGMKDQFQDKAKDLADKAKDKMGQDEVSERGAQRDEVSERVQREEDRMDQDYDA
ncbi:hypothetical protein JHN63_51240 [Streptomyces sp. MBT65]|uniref:hypothetical protein n=1 Tax=Streptomyces sp. MBT65 TaxID=1488395 RepID=UPI00190A850A|nr:hypothetical protein [Streptomyces sp. MBT65]MBK3581978.1 hypothetical protein [Streptomyces sp. MBT65]